MSKVMVSKELFDTLEYALDKECGWDKYELLSEHSRKNNDWHSERLLPLNGLSVLELAEILMKGYELELNPEEVVLSNYYRIIGEYSKKHSNYFLGYIHGLRFAYKQLTGKKMEDK